MIIRSTPKFHDYYDAVGRQGVDRNIVYERRQEDFCFEIKSEPPYWYHDDHHIIVFCRQVFPFVHLTHTDNGPPIKTEDRYCYSLSDVDTFKHAHLAPKDFRKYREDDKRKWRSERENYKERFSGAFLDKARMELVKLADARSCPILYYRSKPNPGHVWTNVKLKDYQFYRMKDTFTAYQELFQFVSAIAQPEKEIPRVPDHILAEIKGFDPPYAFRKMPERK